jgi:hypothetical protein
MHHINSDGCCFDWTRALEEEFGQAGRARPITAKEDMYATKQSLRNNLNLFPKLQILPAGNSKKSEKEKREIPRRRKPAVQ